jgi:hypothetical protein
MNEVWREIIDVASKVVFSFDNQVNQFRRSVAKKIILKIDNIRCSNIDVVGLIVDETEWSLNEALKKRPLKKRRRR